MEWADGIFLLVHVSFTPCYAPSHYPLQILSSKNVNWMIGQVETRVVESQPAIQIADLLQLLTRQVETHKIQVLVQSLCII